MTRSYAVGPGELSIGSTGTAIDFATQTASATVEWSVDSEDDIPLLSGNTEAGEDSYSATISGNVLQDLSSSGIVAFTWENRGEQLPLTYVPKHTEDLAVIGIIKLAPLSVGGEVKQKARSDFEFAFVGEPELVPVEDALDALVSMVERFEARDVSIAAARMGKARDGHKLAKDEIAGLEAFKGVDVPAGDKPSGTEAKATSGGKAKSES